MFDPHDPFTMCKGKNADVHSFKYVYTCDIEDVGFRIKVGNLDGILPPSTNGSHFGDYRSNGGTTKQKSEQQSANQAKNHHNHHHHHHHNHLSASSTASIQNNYNYNVVEVLEELSLIDSVISDDDDDSVDEHRASRANSAKGSSSRSSSPTSSPSSASSSSSSSSSYKDALNKRTKALESRQKRSQKLSQIIFGGLSQPIRALSCHPLITCDLVSNGQRICPPQQTQYRQMSKRYEWNEWLLFSLTLDTLPRDTKVCFTVWDTIGPGKMAAVARTSITLFSKHGCLRRGIYDLRLYFNDDCEDYFKRICENANNNGENKLSHAANARLSSWSSTDITTADLDFNNRDHRDKRLIVPESEFVLHEKANRLSAMSSKNFASKCGGAAASKTQSESGANYSSLYFTSTTQYMQNDLTLYPDGNCGLSKKVKQLNKLKKKYHDGQIPQVTWLDQLTFLKIEHTIVDEKTISTLVFLTVEFPLVTIEGVEHCVVYYEDKEEKCCQYDIIENEIVTILDPEIGLDNLVEQKHHKLARSERSGISDRDLKPNATIRNQLTAIVNCPSTKPLTNEEQDLVWKFRFHLCTQKRALTKFLKTVNWNSHSEVEQAIKLMAEWTPMDVEDALELLSPQFRHPHVRRYAVGRLKEARDEDLQLYLLQLVQALKYEDFNEIRRAFNAEFHVPQQQQQYLQQQPMQQLPYASDVGASKDSLKIFQSNPHASDETFLAESIKIFSTNPTSDYMAPNNNNNNGNSSAVPIADITSNADTNFNRSGSQISSGSFGASIPTPFIPLPSDGVDGGNRDRDLNDGVDAATRRCNEDLASFLIGRACTNDSLANYFFWYLMVECEGAAKSFSIPAPYESSSAAAHSSNHTIFSVNTGSTAAGHSASSTATTTTTDGVDSKMITSAVYNVVDMYLIMLRWFSARLNRGGPEMFARRRFLLRQQEFVIKLVEIMKEVARESGNRLRKIEKLQKILAHPESYHRFNFSAAEPLPLPLNPEIKIVGVAAREATLFKSAMMPAKLAFHTVDGSVYPLIFKHGDDLRQDDLVLQMIILMDKLLRKENLDLKLTPYRVLACSSKHGFVQFIDSLSVAEVLSTEGSIQNYLRKISADYSWKVTSQPPPSSQSLNPTQSISSLDFQFISSGGNGGNGSGQSVSPNNQPAIVAPSLSSANSSSSNLSANAIAPEIMDAYIKSCAGYCIVTYLLGVGDRHLDNLMMTKTGRLFHIDFGFILGRDPKLRPPPMKITREMVDAMGGMSSENFINFVMAVRTAFLHLRRHANLILNLFSLMVDANVPDIALEPDKTVQKVQDKFKLELDDEQAVHHITELVEQSVRSIMPVVVDQLHKMTQYLRN